MHQPSSHRHPSTALASVLVLAALVIAALGSASPVAAASYPIRIEAGPQTGYHFSSTGAITATKTLTFRSPVNTHRVRSPLDRHARAARPRRRRLDGRLVAS